MQVDTKVGSEREGGQYQYGSLLCTHKCRMGSTLGQLVLIQADQLLDTHCNDIEELQILVSQVRDRFHVISHHRVCGMKLSTLRLQPLQMLHDEIVSRSQIRVEWDFART